VTDKRPKHKPRRNRLSELAARNVARPDPTPAPRVTQDELKARLYPIVFRSPN
jgi:hypothetical protein